MLKSKGVGDGVLYAGFAAGAKAAPKSKEKSLWQFVLLQIGGGLFTLLMP